MSIRKFAMAMALAVSLLGVALTSASAQTLKIGIIGPLTGPGATWGAAARMAAEILASEVNDQGGLQVGSQKHKVSVIAYDDQYKAADAVAAYNRLLNQDGVKYMAIVTSAPTMALKDQIERDKIVTLTSAYAPAAVDANTKFMFRCYSISENFLPTYAQWLKNNLKERRLATLNPNDETGWGHAKVTEKHYKDNGFEIVGSQLYERSARDFVPLLTKLLPQKPELIDLGSSAPPTAGLIVRQARELGYKGKFMQSGGAGWSAIVEAAGKEAAEGLINMLYSDPGNPGYQKIVAAYRKAIGQDPTDIIGPYYDAFNVMLKAIQKGGDVNDTTKAAAAFSSVLPIKSVHGDESVYIHQQILSHTYISVLKDGKPVVVGKMR